MVAAFPPHWDVSKEKAFLNDNETGTSWTNGTIDT